MLQAGAILDNKYQIEAVIGQGGFGYVYCARERLTGETFAVKELVPAFVDHPEVVQRFIQEARATLRLTHPHIVRTHGVFEDHGTYYLAMEYLAGGSLADTLEDGPLPPEEAVRIAGEVCEALAYAHDRGVVHCDIKPANVLFDEQGGARLADFGIAHVSAEMMTRQLFTVTGMAMGTVRYMAPEQLEGVRNDPRLDIYALGALLYEMLAGRPYLDFETESTPAAQVRNIQRIQADQPRPLQSTNPDVPQWLAAVVERALRKPPGERFSGAKELVDTLDKKAEPPHQPAREKPTEAVRELVPDAEPAGRERALAEPRELVPEPEPEPAVETEPDEGGGPGLSAIPVWVWAAGALAAVALLVGRAVWLQGAAGGAPSGQTSTPVATSQPIESSPTFEPAEPGDKPTEPPAVEDSFLERAEAGEFDGASVTIMGAFAGGDEEARYTSVNDRFTERTGIQVRYEGTRDFEVLINTRVKGGDPPDVALLPQPGLKDRFAADGELIPLPAEIVERIEANYAPVWLDLGSYEGTPYGVFHRVNAKSYVWYPKKAFEAAGYEEPRTWDELIDLSDQIVADGGTPWCVGMESRAATGWVGTDWLEDVMLRTAGPELYDEWVEGELPFDSDEVRAAMGYIEEIWFEEDYVLGGTTAILTEHFAEASLPMWNDPPGCYLFRQGNFVIGFWPEDIQANVDEEVGVFGFPEIDPAYGTAILGGGDQVVAFRDRPEIMAYLEYLTTGESGELWARAGGALFAHQDQDLGWYETEMEAALAELLLTAEVFRFDASDLMPAEVGAGSFWTGMVDWVRSRDRDTVVQEIDASWPH